MDQLPLDGRITDLAGFARLGAAGRRPAAVRLDQRRDPRLRHPRAGDRPGPRLDLRARRPAGSSWPRSPRTCTASSRCSTRRTRTTARSPSSAARWCATWASPATSACCASRPAWWSALDEAMALPPDQIVLMSTGSQGEPMSALGRMAIGDHRHVTIGPGDTVVLASLAGAGQRDRRLPRDQPARPGPARSSCTRTSPRCTSPATRRPASCSTCSTWSSRATSCRYTASGGTCARTPGWPSESGLPPDRVVLCEDGDVVDLVDGVADAHRPRAAAATSMWTVWPSATSASRCSPSGASSATAASSRRPWWSTRSPARWSAARRCRRKGFSEDPAAFDEVVPLVTEALNQAAAEGITDPHQLAADRAPHGRPLGQRPLPPPPDDRPQRRRGLTAAQRSAWRSERGRGVTRPPATVAR